MVSGYPAVPAHALYVAGRLLATTSHPDTLRWCQPPQPARRRCGGCRRYVPLVELLERRVGWVGFCRRCSGSWARRCERRHGHLPAEDHFWCPACGTIHPDTERAPRKANGTQRCKCVACYHAGERARMRQRRARCR